MILGAGSIGLIFGIIFAGVFFGGCGMLLVGGIGFGVTTAKHKKKRLRVVFLVIAIIGIIMILIPSILLYLMRKDNAEERDGCIETEYNTEYHDEKIDGKYHDYFEYDGKKYVEVRPDSITEADIETAVPDKLLTKDKALLNIHEHIDFMDRLFSDYEQATVFAIDSDYGDGLLTTGSSVFCLEKDLEKVESFYQDFSHYDFFISDDDDWDAREGTSVSISTEMQQISKLNLSKTVKNPKGNEVEVDYISKDNLFEGDLIFRSDGKKAYLFIKEYEGDYEEDYIGEYLRLPDEIAKSIIPKLWGEKK